MLCRYIDLIIRVSFLARRADISNARRFVVANREGILRQLNGHHQNQGKVPTLVIAYRLGLWQEVCD